MCNAAGHTRGSFFISGHAEITFAHSFIGAFFANNVEAHEKKRYDQVLVHDPWTKDNETLQDTMNYKDEWSIFGTIRYARAK